MQTAEPGETRVFILLAIDGPLEGHSEAKALEPGEPFFWTLCDEDEDVEYIYAPRGMHAADPKSETVACGFVASNRKDK